MAMMVRDELDRVRGALREGGVEEWGIEAEVLLRHVLGLERADFLAVAYGGDARLSPGQEERLGEFVGRRLTGEPLAYIVGRREFYGLELVVDESVLIPRQETETLVETALESLSDMGRKTGPVRVVDVGTGCGAIALAIAKHSDRADVVGVDVSAAALEVAVKNAARLGLSDRVRFVRGDLLEAVDGPVDLVVSNPPYIPSGEIGTLAAEVRREPRLALDGGADGLDAFRRLIGQARGKMAADGVMIVELMPEQMDAAARFAVEAMDGARASCRFDLMGNRRALVIEKSG